MVPAHKGLPGYEQADEWAVIAVDEPDTHRMEWFGYSNRAQQGGSTCDAALQVPRTLQASDLGKEVGRGDAINGRPDLGEEIRDA